MQKIKLESKKEVQQKENQQTVVSKEPCKITLNMGKPLPVLNDKLGAKKKSGIRHDFWST